MKLFITFIEVVSLLAMIFMRRVCFSFLWRIFFWWCFSSWKLYILYLTKAWIFCSKILLAQLEMFIFFNSKLSNIKTSSLDWQNNVKWLWQFLGLSPLTVNISCSKTETSFRKSQWRKKKHILLKMITADKKRFECLW